MIQEAIEKIQSLADAARRVSVLTVPGEPPHVAHLVNPDGERERIDLEPGNRNLQLLTITDLIALGKAHFDNSVKSNDRMAVFYNRDHVQLVFDHLNGRERATVTLNVSSEVKFFQTRLTSPQIDIIGLRLALRTILRKTYRDAKLIEMVSALESKKTAVSGSSADRGRESMRADVLEEVAQPLLLPDPYQEFQVRAYTNPDLNARFSLQCLLDPDFSAHPPRWTLQPLEDSWLDFLDLNSKHIGGLLRTAFKDTHVPVYEGFYHQDTPKVTTAK